MKTPLKTAVILLGLACALGARASEALMEKSGCISCHRIDEKLLGPPFRAIAARYRSRPDAATYLFSRVRNGSEDVWGDLPMPPKTAAQLPDDDLKSVIAWLLTL